MKKVNFIGSYDKTNLILYVGKILTTLGKKVLIVDSTLTQKVRYVVPAISPTVAYVTEFEEIDVAVGFQNFERIKDYLGISEDGELDYDYILLDIDNPVEVRKFDVQPTENNYFVTGFDLYSLKRGLEAFNNILEPLNVTKICYSKDMLKEENDYLNFLASGLKVVWKEYIVYFQIENGDNIILAENERLSKIKIKNLSPQYKENLLYIVEDIVKDIKSSDIRKVMKIIEKDKGV